MHLSAFPYDVFIFSPPENTNVSGMIIGERKPKRVTTPSLEGPMDRLTPQCDQDCEKVERVLWQELNYLGEDPRTAPVKKVEHGGQGDYFYLVTQPVNGKA